jgi:hypothetical protein
MQASMHGADRQSRLFGIEGLEQSGFGRCFAHYWKDWKWPVSDPQTKGSSRPFAACSALGKRTLGDSLNGQNGRSDSTQKHPRTDYRSDMRGAAVSGRAVVPRPFDGRLLGFRF